MKFFRIMTIGLALGLFVSLGGCASSSESSSNASSATATSAAESTALPVPASSPLAKIEIGMTPSKVVGLIGDAPEERSYPTGKMFIPFYFGGDTNRTDWIYPGQGKVIFGNTSRFSTAMKVVSVVYDPKQE